MLVEGAGLLFQSPLVAMRESQVKALASLKDKRILGGALDGFCHPMTAHQGLNSELTSADTSPLGWSRYVYTTDWLMQDPNQFSVLNISQNHRMF